MRHSWHFHIPTNITPSIGAPQTQKKIFSTGNLLEVFDDRWQKGATILISQVPVGQWYERMGELTLVDAILDRLVHNAYQIEMKGDSRRK